MRSFAAIVLAAVLAVPLLLAQQNAGSKTRPGDSANAVGNEIGERPSAVLQVVKVKGKLSAVDLKERTVTITPNKKAKEDDDLTLAFAQPNGREQIKVSKKAEKVLGKKRLKLEDLKVGSEVSLEYYPMLGQLMEITVEQPAT